jgi:hypothetical protein
MQQNNHAQIPVQWRSKTQKTMSLSTAEAEHYAAPGPEMAMAVILTGLPPQPPRHQEAQDWDIPLYKDNTGSSTCVIYDNEAN